MKNLVWLFMALLLCAFCAAFLYSTALLEQSRADAIRADGERDVLAAAADAVRADTREAHGQELWPVLLAVIVLVWILKPRQENGKRNEAPPTEWYDGD